MAETYTQEEMEGAYSKEHLLSLEGAWSDEATSFAENFRKERSTPMNKLLRTIGLIILAIVALSRLQFVKSRQFNIQDWDDVYYIGFRK